MLNQNDKDQIKKILIEYQQHLNEEGKKIYQKLAVKILNKEIKAAKHICKKKYLPRIIKNHQLTIKNIKKASPLDNHEFIGYYQKKIYDLLRNNEFYKLPNGENVLVNIFKGKQKINTNLTNIRNKLKALDEIHNKSNEENVSKISFKEFVKSKEKILNVRRGNSKFWAVINKLLGRETTLGVTGVSVIGKLMRFFNQKNSIQKPLQKKLPKEFFSLIKIEEDNYEHNQSTPLGSLPAELLSEIGKHLDNKNLNRLAQVSYLFPPALTSEFKKRREESKWMQFAVGSNYTIGLRKNNTVTVCGNNDWGQCGLDNQPLCQSSTLLDGLNDIIQITAGERHTLFLLKNGTVMACGDNDGGQLGLGDTKTRLVPTLINGLNNVAQIVAGQNHTLFFMQDGTVMTCGNNEGGQLGLGDTKTRLVPTLINGLSDVAQITAGELHTSFLMKNGTVKACGRNHCGELGLGNKNQITTPALINGLNNVAHIAAGKYHTLFLMQDGTVMSCGNNDGSQLGVGDRRPRLIPTLINGLSGVAQIVAGAFHNFFLMKNGSVMACGYNSKGQLGLTNLESYIQVIIPTAIDGLKDVVQIATGSSHTIFVMKDGTVKVCGENGSGCLDLKDKNDALFTPTSNTNLNLKLASVEQVSRTRMRPG